MSRFGILMVVVTLSAGLAAQTSGIQVQDSADARSIKPVTPVPWLDPSLTNSPDRAKMLVIGVASVRSCSAGSSAICYGLCTPSSDHGPDHTNLEPPASRESTPIKQQNALKSKPALSSPEN
jgi:hypothetical protein